MQHEQRGRIQQLESDVRMLRQQLADALAAKETALLGQCAHQQRATELEAALRGASQAAQEKAAELARLEGRASLAEGSLRAAEHKLDEGVAGAQQAHDRALADLRAQHAKQLEQLRAQQERASTQVKEGLEGQLGELVSANAQLKADLRKEQLRSKDLQAQLEKEQSKKEAVKELMRHSSELEAQNERLQAAAAEERRRAAKATAALEAAVTAERHQGELAVQELQLKMQVGAAWHGEVW